MSDHTTPTTSLAAVRHMALDCSGLLLVLHAWMNNPDDNPEVPEMAGGLLAHIADTATEARELLACEARLMADLAELRDLGGTGDG